MMAGAMCALLSAPPICLAKRDRGSHGERRTQLARRSRYDVGIQDTSIPHRCVDVIGEDAEELSGPNVLGVSFLQSTSQGTPDDLLRAQPLLRGNRPYAAAGFLWFVTERNQTGYRVGHLIACCCLGSSQMHA